MELIGYRALRKETGDYIKTARIIIGVYLLCAFVITISTWSLNSLTVMEDHFPVTADSAEKEEITPQVLVPYREIGNVAVIAKPVPVEKEILAEADTANPVTFSTEAGETAAYIPAETDLYSPDPVGKSIDVPVQDTKDDPIVLTGITCRTALRQDYCVGSTETVPALEVYAQMSDGSSKRLETEEYEPGILDTAAAGTKTLSIRYGDYEIELPYQVVDYTATLHLNGGNYPVDSLTAEDYLAELPGTPNKVGCKGGRWYYDEACTIPVETDQLKWEIGQTHMDLYAGYEELGGFILDAEGYVTGYEGEMTSTLMLPDNCVGVRADAFSEETAKAVKYVYIPSNVTQIEPGAFRAMRAVKDYLVIADSNPAYCSINGMIMSKDESRLYVYPAGRRGEDYLPDTVTEIEDYAFYGASLSTLVMETEEPPVLGGAHCFADCSTMLQVPMNSLESYIEAFAVYGLDGNLEGME